MVPPQEVGEAGEGDPHPKLEEVEVAPHQPPVGEEGAPHQLP